MEELFGSELKDFADYWDSPNDFVVDGSDKDNIIHIFPNPANEFLTLRSQSDILSVVITDILGNIVVTKSIFNYSKQLLINIKNIPSGIYFISINDDKAIKFLKE